VNAPLNRPLVLGHRGAPLAAPENTLAAFAAAVRLGADGVELDVHQTADGALAVVHDANLPDGRAVAAVRADELPPGVPLLGDVLDACAGLLVNVEVKTADPAVVVEAVDGCWVVVSSFDWPLVDAARALDPSLPTALLAPHAAGLIEACLFAGHVAAHPHESAVTADLVDRCHRAGVLLTAWTVDDPDRIVALAGLGVDGIVTNVPDVALAALAAAGYGPVDGAVTPFGRR
jgi:glycerophosphoryl diester phosphodiesterase